MESEEFKRQLSDNNYPDRVVNGNFIEFSGKFFPFSTKFFIPEKFEKYLGEQSSRVELRIFSIREEEIAEILRECKDFTFLSQEMEIRWYQGPPHLFNLIISSKCFSDIHNVYQAFIPYIFPRKVFPISNNYVKYISLWKRTKKTTRKIFSS
ncbi:MAG TPA: hypothetical protein VK153_03115 [Candidatus Paceibacterota bacterium]|nr:hypothetical protein [Candidatus Paceibacterota bacterium]